MLSQDMIQLIIMALIGVTLCFFGFRLKRVAFAIAWFVIGYQISSQFVPGFISQLDLARQDLWILGLPIAIGILTTFIGDKIERLCISLICFFAVSFFTYNLLGADANLFGLPTTIVAAIVGVIAAVFAVSLLKPAFILATALIGANVIAHIATLYLAISAAPLSIATLVLMIIGALFQFKNTKTLY